MKSNLTKLAVAAGAFTLCATASAMAGSTSEPGEGAGGAQGAPLPPGLFFVEEDNWGIRDQAGNNHSTLGVNINALVWSTPWTIAGGRLMFTGVLPNAEAGNTTAGGTGNYAASLFNPFLAGTLAWKLGGGLNFSYTFAGYVPLKGDALADPDGDIENRIGVSYLANGWNLSGNFILGTHLQNEAGPMSTTGQHPDYFNIDMTATKTFGKWEVGPIAYYSTDTQNELINGVLAKQSQFAVGGLVGYDWGQLKTQVYVSRDVYQQNYFGYDTRVWARLIVPLGDPFAPATSNMMYHK
jgi:hypothetical protein